MRHGTIAPEPVLRAYTELLRRVIVYARFYSGGDRRMSDDQLYDLMDAVHNVPTLLTENDGDLTDQIIRDQYLGPYDAKWAGKGEIGFSLIAILDEAVRGGSGGDA